MPQPITTKLAKVGFVRKYAGRPFLGINEWGWSRLPAFLKKTRPMQMYGAFLHNLVKLRTLRRQYHGTFFLRNRPELSLIRSLAEKRQHGSTLKIAVLACSNGAEVYSIIWTIRSVRPDINIYVYAIDISNDILEIAKKGIYSLVPDELVGSAILERLTREEIETMFDNVGGRLRIKPWIQENINWQVGDAGDSQLADKLGRQDIVVANKFLCHMDPPEAEACLRNIANLVAAGGYLVVSGIDLDIRTKVAFELGWEPIPDLLEEIHDGDPSVRRDWPWKYWGLEPFDCKKHDWAVRYASVFQLGNPNLRREGFDPVSGSKSAEDKALPIH